MEVIATPRSAEANFVYSMRGNSSVATAYRAHKVRCRSAGLCYTLNMALKSKIKSMSMTTEASAPFTAPLVSNDSPGFLVFS